MYYIIGDIHGYFSRLVALFDKLTARLQKHDMLIFLGDYIDRGEHSYEVIDFLVNISRTKSINSVFLKGNHEDMFMGYLRGDDDGGSFLINGGDATVRSYMANRGEFSVPKHHDDFFRNLTLYHEGEDFIAVHAGLNPDVESIEAQKEQDLIWIRENFYRADKRWDKTVIFGHTPVSYLTRSGPVFRDERRNIIGIDSGVIFGNPLVCLVWPEQTIISG